MHYTIVTPIVIFSIFLFLYGSQTILLLAWSGKMKFREYIYNLNREVGFLPELLAGSQFRYTVDLGCGYGLMGRYLRDHTENLVGVDTDSESLKWLGKKRLYDKTIQADIRLYEIPNVADSIFLVEVLEHLDRKDGEALLNKLREFPFVCVVTPTKFHDCFLLAWFTRNRAQTHQSVWSEDDFEKLGYRVHNLKYSGVRRFHGFVFGNEILAIRHEEAPSKELADEVMQ